MKNHNSIKYNVDKCIIVTYVFKESKDQYKQIYFINKFTYDINLIPDLDRLSYLAFDLFSDDAEAFFMKEKTLMNFINL
jgi:hypothetical protein